MWHDVLVEQLTLAERAIRTIEGSGRQLRYMARAQGATAQRGFYVLTHSAHVGLLIGTLGVGRVLGGERVEDGLRGGVSIGTRAISLGV
jgi:hypothetical protein